MHPGSDPLELFFSSGGFQNYTQFAALQKKVLGTIKDLIYSVNLELSAIVKNHKEMTSLKNQLEAAATQINSDYASLQSQLSSQSSKGKSLSNRLIGINSSLKNLTTKQQELIAAKIGQSLATGGLAPAGDSNASVGFNPGFSPAFAAFSFGAYTHRNGMSQYGALGRANSGQSAEQILVAYYPGETLNKSYPVPATIYVHGTNEYGQNFNCVAYSFNDYVKRLYEVPSSWPVAVLRAQAVAARSYAVRYISTTGNRCNGQPYICPSQSCQVVKYEINASSWQTAVNDTTAWVLSGGPGNFQYSSTSGGYLNTSGWDTTSHSIDSWPANAYENIAGSPWFYKGWYRAGTSNSGATCGRSNPWLNETEFTDVLNSWVVYTNGSNGDKARVTTWDTGCWGGTPYSIGEMKSRADALGGSYNRVYGISSSFSTNGFTSSVSLSTDRGAVTIDGPTFRDIFNFRAPGYLVMKTPLYNVERK